MVDMTKPIYLDHCATTGILPAVAKAIDRASVEFLGNPSSQHEPGRKARRALEEARQLIGQLLGAQVGGSKSDQVIFTSGGTEANNLAMSGLLPESPPPGGNLILSSLEHPSVSAMAGSLKQQGWQVHSLDAQFDGTVSLEQLKRRLNPQTKLVSLMLANNETGVLQPVAEAAKWCQARSIAIHTDAIQVVGKLPVDFRGLGVSTLSLTAHKFHGPKGIGALILRHGFRLRKTMHGGHQQAGYRPGTEPVALAIGLQVALECWHKEALTRQHRLGALQKRFDTSLKIGWPSAVILGQSAQRVPHTTNIAFPGLNRQALVMALDLAGIACSTGSACASGASFPSPVLTSMGCTQEVIDSSVRFSWGALTTVAEIDEASRRILNVCHRLRHDE
jgi:cysteine desulfurase